MTPRQIHKILADLFNLFEANGLYLPDGTFDPSKLDTLQEDVLLAHDIEVVLQRNGILMPARVDQILALLPLIAGFLQ